MKYYKSTLKLSANIIYWVDRDRILKKARKPYSKVLSVIWTTTARTEFICVELFPFNWQKKRAHPQMMN